VDVLSVKTVADTHTILHFYFRHFFLSTFLPFDIFIFEIFLFEILIFDNLIYDVFTFGVIQVIQYFNCNLTGEIAMNCGGRIISEQFV
jgi:hypothetical protein